MGTLAAVAIRWSAIGDGERTEEYGNSLEWGIPFPTHEREFTQQHPWAHHPPRSSPRHVPLARPLSAARAKSEPPQPNRGRRQKGTKSGYDDRRRRFTIAAAGTKKRLFFLPSFPEAAEERYKVVRFLRSGRHLNAGISRPLRLSSFPENRPRPSRRRRRHKAASFPSLIPVVRVRRPIQSDISIFTLPSTPS